MCGDVSIRLNSGHTSTCPLHTGTLAFQKDQAGHRPGPLNSGRLSAKVRRGKGHLCSSHVDILKWDNVGESFTD